MGKRTQRRSNKPAANLAAADPGAPESARLERSGRTYRRPLAIGIPLFILLGAAAFLLVSNGRVASREQLSVLLISLDTTRADHLGCYGHPLARTPNIDALAAEGALFTQCVTSAPTTFPAHASLMTGTYPFVHGARVNAQFELNEHNSTLAETLKSNGFVAGAEVAAMVLNREYGLAQGFDTYVDPRETRYRKPNPADQPVNERIAEDVCDGAIRFLRDHRDDRFFLFLHLFDAHLPHQAPQPFRSQFKDGYLAELAYMDHQLGRVLRELETLKLKRRTLVVLTGDHGEGRGQHGEEEHGLLVYDSTLSVPLIMRLPGWIAPRQRLAGQVRHVDVAPTVLDFLGLATTGPQQGQSLKRWLSGEQAPSSLPAYSETLSPLFDYSFAPLRSLRDDGWKYVLGPSPELYHVSADPKEEHNLIEAEPQRAQRMRAALADMIANAPKVVDPSSTRRKLSAEERGSLQALGYLGSETETEQGDATASNDLLRFPPSGLNAVDHAEEVRTLSRCMAMVNGGRYEEASIKLRAFLAAQPADRKGLFNANRLLANALTGLGRLDEAAEYYRKALAERPTDFITLTDLGGALLRQDKPDDAILMFELALKHSGDMPFVHLQLAAALTAKGSLDEAIAHCQSALKTDPKLANAHAALAGIYVKAGRKADALEAIRKALEINPANPAFRKLFEELGGGRP